jgi:Transposase DDE domain group 1
MVNLIRRLSRRTRIWIVFGFFVLSTIFVLLHLIYRESYFRVISILVFLPAIPFIIAREKEPYRSNADYFWRLSLWSRRHPNMTSSPEAVVHFYNKRGTCEQNIKEGKHALTWTRLSCTRFSSNRVRLALFVLAYNIGNFMRRFALPSEVSHWSLSSIQLKLVKIGAKIVSHSRMTIFQMAEVAVPERLFRSMLSRIHRLGRACARAPALSL